MNDKDKPDSVFRQYFVYSTEAVTIAATIGAVGQFTISILADADFECNYITGISTQAGLIVLTWGGLIQINDSGVGKTFYNTPIPFDSGVGNGREPYPLNPPRFVSRQSTLIVTFTNNIATETVVILSLHGNKLFAGETPLTADMRGGFR